MLVILIRVTTLAPTHTSIFYLFSLNSTEWWGSPTLRIGMPHSQAFTSAYYDYIFFNTLSCMISIIFSQDFARFFTRLGEFEQQFWLYCSQGFGAMKTDETTWCWLLMGLRDDRCWRGNCGFVASHGWRLASGGFCSTLRWVLCCHVQQWPSSCRCWCS